MIDRTGLCTVRGTVALMFNYQTDQCEMAFRHNGKKWNVEIKILNVADEVSAGDVPAGINLYTVTNKHSHKTLSDNDRVRIIEDPRGINWLLRESDWTLHSLEDDNDQYVHLVKE